MNEDCARHYVTALVNTRRLRHKDISGLISDLETVVPSTRKSSQSFTMMAPRDRNKGANGSDRINDGVPRRSSSGHFQFPDDERPFGDKEHPVHVTMAVSLRLFQCNKKICFNLALHPFWCPPKYLILHF